MSRRNPQTELHRQGSSQGVLGFDKLGISDRPSSGNHARSSLAKEVADPSRHGVADALNAQARGQSRGVGRCIRDIQLPAECMPWQNSPEQLEFLRGATKEERDYYRRITKVVYGLAGGHGANVEELLRQQDKHRCGRVSRATFTSFLLSVMGGDLPKEEADEVARKLDKGRGDRSVDVDLFLAVFVKDQQRTPAGGLSIDHRGEHQSNPHRHGGPTPRTNPHRFEGQRNEAPPRAPEAATSLNRQQWLRELLKGAPRGKYRAVGKLLALFEEASWKGQGQLLYCLRAGDRRQTGAMRLRDLVSAIGVMGLHLSKEENDDLFQLFDRDHSGDVTFDELVELLEGSRSSSSSSRGEGGGGGDDGGGVGSGDDGGGYRGEQQQQQQQQQHRRHASQHGGGYEQFAKDGYERDPHRPHSRDRENRASSRAGYDHDEGLGGGGYRSQQEQHGHKRGDHRDDGRREGNAHDGDPRRLSQYDQKGAASNEARSQQQNEESGRGHRNHENGPSHDRYEEGGEERQRPVSAHRRRDYDGRTGGNVGNSSSRSGGGGTSRRQDHNQRNSPPSHLRPRSAHEDNQQQSDAGRRDHDRNKGYSQQNNRDSSLPESSGLKAGSGRRGHSREGYEADNADAPRPASRGFSHRQEDLPPSTAAAAHQPNKRYALEQKRRAMLAGRPEGTWRAFKRLTNRLAEMQPPMDQRRLMRAFDGDRNGLIDRRELSNGLMQLGIHVPEGDVSDLYLCLDANRDGKVNADELCVLLDV